MNVKSVMVDGVKVVGLTASVGGRALAKKGERRKHAHARPIKVELEAVERGRKSENERANLSERNGPPPWCSAGVLVWQAAMIVR